jgi:alpha-tubulin suppressor-like RCC1 family protein
MALTEDGMVYVWGRNNFGQIGNGTVAAVGYGLPQPVYSYQTMQIAQDGTETFHPVARRPIRFIAAGANHCLVATEPSPTRISPRPISSVIGDGNLSRFQYVFAWGKNDLGQLATNDQVTKSIPTHRHIEFYHWTDSSKQVTGLAAGASHSVGAITLTTTTGAGSAPSEQATGRMSSFSTGLSPAALRSCSDSRRYI